LHIDRLFTGLKIYHMQTLASLLEIHNYYDLCFQKKAEGFFVSTDCSCPLLIETIEVPNVFAPKYTVSDVKKLLRCIKNNSAPLIHIFLTVPSKDNTSHAVLLTIRKRPDKKPLLMLFNSNGRELNLEQNDKQAITEAKHIIKFIKSLDIA